MSDKDISQIVELVLSELYVDTFDNYNEDKRKIVTSIDGYDIGYHHDGKTLTHDIFIGVADQTEGGVYTRITGDIRSNRDRLAERAFELFDHILRK